MKEENKLKGPGGLISSTLWGEVIICRDTKVGTLPNGDEILALTDAMGSQLVIKGSKTHLITMPLGSHEAAVRIGESILAAGTHEVYPYWCNLI